VFWAPSIEGIQCGGLGGGEEVVVPGVIVPYLDPAPDQCVLRVVVETLKEMGLDIRREKGAEESLMLTLLR
jgi:hypothetical protein